MSRITFILLAFTVLLASCGPQTATTRSGAFDPYVRSEEQVTPAPQQPPFLPRQPSVQTNKVAILLPLSGPHSQIGESLLNAAQLALFDMKDPSVELVPFDTQGTPTGTANAMTKAIRNNVKLVLGPVLADNVDQAGKMARQHNLNVIGFTTDSARTGGNVFTVGILPYDQGQRLAQYAGRHKLNRIVAIIPQNQYAQEITTAFEKTASSNGLSIVQKVQLSPASDVNVLAQQLASAKGQFDALLMPVGNPQMVSLAQALTNNGLSATNVAWLGADLWDDTNVTSNPLMRGALYAAPSTQTRRNFVAQYRTVYGQTPQRLSSLGYDATALAIVLLKQRGGQITTADLLNSNGFNGVDGVFRFNSNGMTERGMAIHRISGRDQTQIAERAPTGFR